MIIQIFILSLQIIAIKIAFMEGMVFGEPRIFMANMLDKAFGKKWSQYIQKPLWNCFACMGSIWTIILTWSLDIHLILAVVGANYLLDNLIPDRND